MDDQILAFFMGEALFRFSTRQELVCFLQLLFSHCRDAAALYAVMMRSNTHVLLRTCISDSSIDGQVRILEALRIIQEMYGDAFDPEGLMFRIEERSLQQ